MPHRSRGLRIRNALAAAATAMALLAPAVSDSAGQPNRPAAGTIPIYPAHLDCSPLTSLFSSWNDVDGSKRSEPHSGVDGGRLGEPIFAPAAGVVIAAWEADWGWGPEGALLIRHGRSDLGLRTGPSVYYSEFDHLRYDEIRSSTVGQQIRRGERLATVHRPGGKNRYAPEVHWEVWAIGDAAATIWRTNEFGGKYWTNRTGHLVDPLPMLGLDSPRSPDGGIRISVFDPRGDERNIRGFTYILPCIERKREGSERRHSSRR